MAPGRENVATSSNIADSSDEEQEDTEWLNHPARKLLKDAFLNEEIPLDWNRQPKDIYDKFAHTEAFAGVRYDKTFQSRLRSLRNIVKVKAERKTMDQNAFNIFQKNFPVRQFNDVGVLKWHGSLAEMYLKQDMAAGLHLGKKPQEFRATRAEYMLYSKTTFRKHIDQEKRLGKLHNFLEDMDEKKKKKTEKKKKGKTKKKGKKKKVGSSVDSDQEVEGDDNGTTEEET